MTNRKKHNLILDVENFGPIAEAKGVEIKPMTVFVGPSNTGKSYLAILLHSMLQAMDDSRMPSIRKARQNVENHLDGYEALVESIKYQYTDKGVAYHNDEHEHLNLNLESMPKQSKEIIELIQEELIDEIVHGFQRSIQSFFEVSGVEELTSSGNDLAQTINMRSSDKTWSLGLNRNTAVYDLRSVSLDLPDFILSQLINSDNESGSRPREIDMISLYQSIRFDTLFYFALNDSVYFPAARTGIITSHRILTNRLISNASRYGFEKEEVLPFSRVARDFLDYLVRINELSTSMNSDQHPLSEPVARIVQMLNDSLISGEITVQDAEYGPPEFIYSHNGTYIPMTRSSSMVTELAPIILFLKNFVNPGDLLIIEEPEAHLHPAAQQKMAAALAFMVRKGLRVLITTHSHYMVEQMSTFVNASHADPEERASKLRLLGPDVDKDVYLNEDDIAVYDFDQQSIAGGTVVSEVVLDTGEYIFAPENHSKAISDQFNRNSRMLSTRINKE